MPTVASAEEEAKRLERIAKDRRNAGEGLLILGILLLAGGLYFLGNASQNEVMGQAIVNLQRLVVGQTAAIVGAIFVGSGSVIRYRR